jgi:hypothetical protein
VLKVGILDKKGDKAHLSDNLDIELVVDGKFFQVSSSHTNETLHTGVTLVPGQTRVSCQPGRTWYLHLVYPSQNLHHNRSWQRWP